MIIVTDYYRLELDDRTGTLVSLADGRRELLHRGPTPIPLFSLRLRTATGAPIDVTAHDATTVAIEARDDPDGTTVDLRFVRLTGRLLDVHVRMAAPRTGHLTFWRLGVENDTDDTIEWVRFPDLAIPDDLVSTGGEARLLWPAIEGVLVDDASLRDRTWLCYEGVAYPSKGWEGFYPGACTTQFMAYYDRHGGLYVGAHDEHAHPKAIEYYLRDGGIRLEFRLYPGAVGRGTWSMDYDMVLGVFHGDWYAAAQIYRDWFSASALPKPPRLVANTDLPDWLHRAPLVAIYPVRGQQDTGDMTPNEYFPYTQAIPALEHLAHATGTQVMALLMHWEGTAPWAPPSVWPPFGGVQGFADFVDRMHARGHLVGVYCSGIGWTQESLLVPYDRRAQFDHEGLRAAMCLSPTGDLAYSRICAGAQRWGYDLCPTTPYATEVVADQIAQIAASGCDYIQFFDQNLGGTPYFCYSREHGHPPAPGPWQIAAMAAMHEHIAHVQSAGGQTAVIGCEGAAAEPYLRHLPFNDLRYQLALYVGRPIPLYAFLYHEYIVNFMGNQAHSTLILDCAASPENLQLRLAYSFVAGDLLAVTLKDGGEIHWGWGAPWEMEAPNQGAALRLLAHLTAWRQHAARDYLCYGRMERPAAVETEAADQVLLVRTDGSLQTWEPIVTSRWTGPHGHEAQILVNYRDRAVDCVLLVPDMEGRAVAVVADPQGQTKTATGVRAGRVRLRLDPLSALLIEFGPENPSDETAGHVPAV